MKRWIVRTLVVAAVVGAYAVGHGLHASAEVPGRAQVFGCGYTNRADGVPEWLNKICDNSKSFTVTHYLVSGPGTGEEYYMCCVRK